MAAPSEGPCSLLKFQVAHRSRGSRIVGTSFVSSPRIVQGSSGYSQGKHCVSVNNCVKGGAHQMVRERNVIGGVPGIVPSGQI